LAEGQKETEMTDEEFDILMQYINLRVNAIGKTSVSSSQEIFMNVLKDEFNTILQDQEAMATALGDQSLADLTAKRDVLDAERSALDAEITRLETRPDGKGAGQ
jgi:hypothetical protein